MASLLIESLKPSNITYQLWSANAYVKNLIIKSWIIILKLKIMGRELEKNGLVLKVPKIKLETSRSSFDFGGVKIFNNLPLNLRKSVLA